MKSSVLRESSSINSSDIAGVHEQCNMSLWLTMMSCVTSLTVVALLTTQGVCGEEWSVTYQSGSICAFVGSSVTLFCSYTYPSYLTIRQVYWTKLYRYEDPPRLRDDPEYTNRISEVCQYGTKRCDLNIKSLTKLDIGEYYCRTTTNDEGQKSIGTPGIYLDVKDAPQTSVSISPHGNIQEGTDVTLTCTSIFNVPVKSYSWFKTPSLIAMGTGKTYTIKHIRPEDSGWYGCWSEYECGFRYSLTHLQVLYSPKNTTVFTRPSGVITKGSSVTLTCSSDANPPVEIYIWFKVGEYTPVGSGQQYSITNIRSEDGGQYYCEARNTYGAGNSSILSVIVEGDQSPVLIPVVAVSVCGLVCLLCAFVGVKKMRRRKKPEDQDHQNTSNKLQSRGGAEDDDQYSTIQPQLSRETAGAQGDDVQYSSVQFKKASSAHGSPDQPEGELSVIYSTVETRA